MIGKVISQIGKAAAKASAKTVKTGKPNLPRYLYHVTSRKNYESILKSGEIRTSHDAYLASNLEGVFMFDLKNFAKRWTTTFFDFGEEYGKINLGSTLISKNSDMVVLKVPTKKMDINKLKVRVQDENKSDFHALNGASARFQTLYTRRKKPIEYIYGQNIKVSETEKIGELKLDFTSDDRDDFLKFVANKPFDSLIKLFKGKPEENCIKAMHKANISEKCLYWG